jgi:hypothetical protein
MNTAEFTIVEFLKTGSLKQLNLGMNLNAVVEYLGIPDGYAAENLNKAQLKVVKQNGLPDMTGLGYGCLELIFEREQDTLISIAVELDKSIPRNIPSSLGSDWLSFIDGMTSSEFVELLQKHEIDWYWESSPSAEALYLRIKPSCVEASFDLEDGAYQIYTLTKSVWGSDCVSF